MSNLELNLDDSLLHRLKIGDESALTELYTKYWKVLFMSSFNVLKDKAICEDIIQDIFIDIWRKREELEINTSLKGYLYACVRYQVFAQIKKNKDRIHIEFFEDLDKRLQCTTPETQMIEVELGDQLSEVISTLPAKCQQVYKLSREEQLTHKEIAERLDISVKTVENHIAKALQIIRLSLGNSFSAALILWISTEL